MASNAPNTIHSQSKDAKNETILKDESLKESSGRGPVESAEVSELRRKLDAAEKLLAAHEEKERARVEAAAGARINKDEVAFVGENGGWLHEVGPQNKDCGLDTVKIKCVDESEAIRWYTRTRDFPVGSGIAVDPMNKKIGRIIATCIDPGRQRLIALKTRMALVRSKLNSGTGLSDAEKAFLEKHEEEILGFKF